MMTHIVAWMDATRQTPDDGHGGRTDGHDDRHDTMEGHDMTTDDTGRIRIVTMVTNIPRSTGHDMTRTGHGPGTMADIYYYTVYVDGRPIIGRYDTVDDALAAGHEYMTDHDDGRTVTT